MTSDLLSVNLVSAEGAKDTVKAVKDPPFFRFMVDRGQLAGVVFQAVLAEVPHHPKCLARWIHNTRYYGGHFGVGFSSFASGWPRSASGRGLLSVSGWGTPPPKMSGKVNS